MKLSKKIVSLFTITALVTSLTACGSSSEKSGSGSSDKKTFKIGICQLVEHEALDAATKGFKKALTDKLGEGNVEFDEQNAQGESTNCSTICNGFVTNGVDLIMANATGALQAAVSATNEIPIVGTSVTDYGTALNMKDWNGTSGTNVTGTADLAPIDEQEDMILRVAGYAKKTVVIVYAGSAVDMSRWIGAVDGVVFSGGVASNSMLRELTATLHPVFAQPQFSTDNAMGVAVLTKRLTEE